MGGNDVLSDSPPFWVGMMFCFVLGLVVMEDGLTLEGGEEGGWGLFGKRTGSRRVVGAGGEGECSSGEHSLG